MTVAVYPQLSESSLTPVSCQIQAQQPDQIRLLMAVNCLPNPQPKRIAILLHTNYHSTRLFITIQHYVGFVYIAVLVMCKPCYAEVQIFKNILFRSHCLSERCSNTENDESMQHLAITSPNNVPNASHKCPVLLL